MTPPKKAATWRLFNAQGGRLGVTDDDGVMRYEFPVQLFTVDAIRTAWGTGRYTVQWLTADGKPSGRVPFELGAGGAAAPPPREVTPEAPPPQVGGPMGEAMALMLHLDGIANRRAQGILDSFGRLVDSQQAAQERLLAAVVGQNTRPAVAPELVQLLQGLTARLTALENLAAGGEDAATAGGGEVEEELDAPESWDDLPDYLFRALKRKVPDLEERLPDLIAAGLAKLTKAEGPPNGAAATKAVAS